MPRTHTHRILLAALATFAASNALAKPASHVKVGGKIVTHYEMDLTEGADKANEFAIKRVYITAKAKITDTLSTRVTTDVGRLKSQHSHNDDGAEVEGEDTKLTPFIKYAYLQWKAPVDGVKLQFGAAGTGWTGLYDKFWGRRWVSKSFADHNKVLSTSDLGVHAKGSHKDGFVQWHGGLINGSGYGKSEGDKAKTAQLRLTVDPMAGSDSQLPISAFVSHDVGAEDDPATVMAGGLGYKSSLGLAWFEFLNRSQGDLASQGLSVSVVPHLGDVASLLLRLDQWDPNTDTGDDGVRRVLAGVTKNFAKKIDAGLLYERSQQESQDDPQHGVFVRVQAGF